MCGRHRHLLCRLTRILFWLTLTLSFGLLITEAISGWYLLPYWVGAFSWAGVFAVMDAIGCQRRRNGAAEPQPRSGASN